MRVLIVIGALVGALFSDFAGLIIGGFVGQENLGTEKFGTFCFRET